MGTTLLRGLLNAGLVTAPQIWATARTPETCDQVAQEFGIAAMPDYEGIAGASAIVLICCKPYQIAPVAGKLRAANLPADTIFISVLAGVTLERLESLLPGIWIRSLPNTPSAVGEGMTVVAPGHNATPETLEVAQRIFSSVGRSVVVEESYCNAVTALSGSGPAYMYLVMEALADAGVRVGLRRDLALTLVAQTMLGSAKMVLETGRHPASLRDDVTTPAGCTIAGLLMLEDGKIRSVLARAVEEATKIVEQLGKPPRH